jgi:multidrug transporter EmrE-like cation transporter
MGERVLAWQSLSSGGARLMEHLFIFSTILFTLYSQLVMRWQVGSAGALPADAIGKVQFVAHLLLNPWVLSGMLASFAAGISWMLAMTRFEVSYAFPFVSINYVLVLAAGVLLFQESMSATKILGSALVVVGIIVIAKG